MAKFTACAYAFVQDLTRPPAAFDAALTRETLALGHAVLPQAILRSAPWQVVCDLILQSSQVSELGAFSYAPQIHLREGQSYLQGVLTLGVACDILQPLQGAEVEFATVITTDGRSLSLRMADYIHYSRRTMARVAHFIETRPELAPVPCSYCDKCANLAECQAIWRAQDSLYTLPDIRQSQVKKLVSEGVRSLTDLARREQRVSGLNSSTLERLSQQARLQKAAETSGLCYELRAAAPGKGFALLPRPQAGDVFFAIEALTSHNGERQYRYSSLCQQESISLSAEAPSQEAEVFSEYIEGLRRNLLIDPEACLYHFGSSHLSHLRNLCTRFGAEEAFVDRLLREQRLIDLQKVVRGGLIASVKGYSLTELAPLFTATAQEGSLQTLTHLRDWLISIRPDGIWPVGTQESHEKAEEKETQEDQDIRNLRAMIAKSDLPLEQQQLLFNLGMFHKRELKPAQWAVFDSQAKDDEDLLNDLDALAGLTALGASFPVKRSFGRKYRYAVQETKLRAGKKATIASFDAPPVTVTIEDLDRRAREVVLKVGPGKEALLRDRLNLHPDWPLDTKVISAALLEVISDQCQPQPRYQAVRDLLQRRPPNLGEDRLESLPDVDLVARSVRAIGLMQNTVLPIQGPPGTGKTYVTAQAILSLVDQGARIGVASNSHEAVRNLLLGCVNAAAGVVPDIIHKVSSGADGYQEDCPITRTTDNATASAGGQIVGGTAFLFAREENIQAFDWLFVDEAGQVGLANMAAMGRAARNIVLVGDPRQLPQVVQGSHPEPANLSCLEWLLAGEPTVPPELGIFLPVSRRMHPQICDYISEQVYDGRLLSHEQTAQQMVFAQDVPNSGAYWLGVEHEGNTQIALEEAARLQQLIAALLQGRWQDKDGNIAPISAQDIIVVAPYNAQVNALAEHLPQGIRIGTVDKFQGQEAPICLISMTASSVEDSARGMEFLFSLNRINVAVSRAKALAIVVGAPRLRAAQCETLDQIRLVNTLCALPDLPQSAVWTEARP